MCSDQNYDEENYGEGDLDYNDENYVDDYVNYNEKYYYDGYYNQEYYKDQNNDKDNENKISWDNCLNMGNFEGIINSDIIGYICKFLDAKSICNFNQSCYNIYCKTRLIRDEIFDSLCYDKTDTAYISLDNINVKTHNLKILIDERDKKIFDIQRYLLINPRDMLIKLYALNDEYLIIQNHCRVIKNRLSYINSYKYIYEQDTIIIKNEKNENQNQLIDSNPEQINNNNNEFNNKCMNMENFQEALLWVKNMDRSYNKVVYYIKRSKKFPQIYKMYDNFTHENKNIVKKITIDHSKKSHITHFYLECNGIKKIEYTSSPLKYIEYNIKCNNIECNNIECNNIECNNVISKRDENNIIDYYQNGKVKLMKNKNQLIIYYPNGNVEFSYEIIETDVPNNQINYNNKNYNKRLIRLLSKNIDWIIRKYDINNNLIFLLSSKDTNNAINILETNCIRSSIYQSLIINKNMFNSDCDDYDY